MQPERVVKPSRRRSLACALNLYVDFRLKIPMEWESRQQQKKKVPVR
jgi:hypothetical protein